MEYKRVYKCLRNAAPNGGAAIAVTDEEGQPVNTSFYPSFDETISYFYELKDELTKNPRLEIIEIDEFHFECRNIESVSIQNGAHR